MILGHEAVGEVVEVGTHVRDFKVGDKVLVSAITPDWNSRQAQEGFAMHSGGMLSGWKFSNFKDGVFAEYFHVNDADGNLAHLPEGMDTALGDRGIRLSGGERQRIVLARVLLGKPSLIILDEATSALDYESEAMFHQIIRRLRAQTAVVLIAHRLSTVRMADRAIVLEDGKIAEQGTVEALIGRENGFLAGMAALE